MADALELEVSHVDRALRERGLGVFEGLTRAEAEERWPDEWAAWRRDPMGSPIPEGEPYEEFRARVVAGLIAATRRLAKPKRPALVVTHGGTLKAIIRSTLETRALVTIPNGALFRFTLEDGRLHRTFDD